MHYTWDETKIDKTDRLNIIIYNVQINPFSSRKLIGLFTDETLSGCPHIDHLCSVISSRISVLK